jgi:hypothetical protein
MLLDVSMNKWWVILYCWVVLYTSHWYKNQYIMSILTFNRPLRKMSIKKSRTKNYFQISLTHSLLNIFIILFTYLLPWLLVPKEVLRLKFCKYTDFGFMWKNVRTSQFIACCKLLCAAFNLCCISISWLLFVSTVDLLLTDPHGTGPGLDNLKDRLTWAPVKYS